MSVPASQFSRDCESGWTVYLDESQSLSPEEWRADGRSNYREELYRGGGAKVEGEDEENLSMMSDASSGPPFHEVEDDCSNEGCSAALGSGKHRSKGKKKTKGSGKEEQHLNYHYADTACSTHLECAEEKTESQSFRRNKISAPAEKANSGKKGGMKSRKWA